MSFSQFLYKRLGMFTGLLLLNVHASVYSGALDLTYSFTGNFSENFDSMGTGILAPQTVGVNSPWSVVTNVERFNSLTVADSPTDPRAAINKAYNGGVDPDGDKALGIYRNSVTQGGYLTARFTNNTGNALSNVNLLFDVELMYQESSGKTGGIQAFISKDNLTYYDLGNTFEGLVTSNGANTNYRWLSDDVNGNANRNIGGLVDLQSFFGSAIAVGSDFFVRFDLKNNVTTVPPAYCGCGPKGLVIFVDNVRMVDTPIPEPSTYFLLVTFLLVIYRLKQKKIKTS
jgi:hypothetical protein